MRIITGKYKGRRFEVPRTFKARPTTDFAKENIFNVLNSYTDFDSIHALDLFSGTGSITLELLSRGCAEVVSVELDRAHHAFIRQCVERIGAPNAILVRGDVFRYLKSCHRQFDLIFADPPYALEQLATLPSLILEGGLLAPDGVFVLEHGKQHDFSSLQQFVERRTYGSVNFSLFMEKGKTTSE